MVLLPWQNPIHGTPGLGNGLWALPWTSCCSELREPHCSTAENPGSLLGKCCSCFCSVRIRTGWAWKSPFPGCSRMACGENRAGVPSMLRMRSMFLPLLHKAIAPSWAWGHQLVPLDILGASSSLLFFLSFMLFHHHWALSCVLQKSFPSCLLLKRCSADNPASKIPAESQTDVSKAALLQMLV